MITAIQLNKSTTHPLQKKTKTKQNKTTKQKQTKTKTKTYYTGHIILYAVSKNLGIILHLPVTMTVLSVSFTRLSHLLRH